MNVLFKIKLSFFLLFQILWKYENKSQQFDIFYKTKDIEKYYYRRDALKKMNKENLTTTVTNIV